MYKNHAFLECLVIGTDYTRFNLASKMVCHQLDIRDSQPYILYRPIIRDLLGKYVRVC